VVLLGRPLSAVGYPAAVEVEAWINSQGADAVLQRMATDPGLAAHVYGNTRQGSAEWLQLAAQLRLHAASVQAAALGRAVGEALPRAPYRVLALLAAGGFSVAEVCRPQPPITQPARTIAIKSRRLERALAPVTTAKYRQVKAECLDEARAARTAAESIPAGKEVSGGKSVR